ncbi:DUF308 domain-containing protein [Anaerobacillus sp. MEB173]|uniref:DUF308 domain-containing protein n=1 Tax=Anaerobacillus sp. MEB173 TaxID=3383345 RepID=UPI003F8E9B1A
MADINNRDERSLNLDNEERDGVAGADFPGDYEEETAAEVAPGARPFTEDVDRGVVDDREDATEGRGVGVFALVLSILSLFFLPVILGAAGIIVGFIARRNGANALGNWAIGIGVVSIVITLFFAPFF